MKLPRFLDRIIDIESFISIDRELFMSRMAKKFEKELLINAVRNEPRLWDQREKAYHNRDVKPELWQYIGDEFSMKGEEVRKIWANLRDAFRRKYRMRHAIKSGQESSIPDRWPYFESMLFLKDVVTAKESSGNLTETFIHSNGESEPLSLDGTPNTAVEVDINYNEPEEDLSKKLQSASNTSQSKSPKLVRSEKKKKNDLDAQALKIEKRKIDLFEDYLSKKKNKYQDDEDYAFFMSLLPTVKELTLVEKMNLRMKILRDVTDALEAHNYSSNMVSSIVSSSPSAPDVLKQSVSFVPPGISVSNYWHYSEQSSDLPNGESHSVIQPNENNFDTRLDCHEFINL